MPPVALSGEPRGLDHSSGFSFTDLTPDFGSGLHFESRTIFVVNNVLELSIWHILANTSLPINFFEDKLYRLTLQTRVNPDKLAAVRKKDDKEGEYWLLPSEDDIRPYGGTQKIWSRLFGVGTFGV
ncbi:hypothetical protein DdX_19454 [Ditylenchus destructor]|uniref:Uncharacterized protein n=1 Tax=Ditylenchus destructor TaxID=166010 RepID=A0AAD4MIY9_9BILA|nr:hypothetical protein DdX_19454 [Ditylenchus destructor]